ncbi:nucleotide-binding alpha-beta plait domain-containing protein [Tanacetum coccineum]
MGSYKTKKDDVARISTSIYITNFSEMLSAKELFHACNQYGHVVDSFIPTKKSKNSKRFGFVRFINVFNEERLVNNLCTVWIDRYKIHANIARFQRPDAKKEGTGVKKSYAFPLPNEHLKTNVKAGEGNSYMGVLKWGKRVEAEDTKSEPSIVLGDECAISKNLSNVLLGRVKEFASLANLKLALGNEGFVDITIKYMGELWVMLEFNSEESKNKFNDNVSVASWFSQIIEASTDFEIEGRIAWVEVEGIPFKLWSGNTFSRIANKWGKLLDVDDQEEICFHSKRLCIHMKSGKSINEEFKFIYRGKTYWIRANETPGWVPDFTDEVDDEDHDEINSMAEEDEVQKSGGMYENYGSPTEEFQFGKGLKQGDPLSPFLFILIMETLHISFQRVVDARMFHGIKLGSLVNLSHMFYADDAVFVGEWSESNITTLVHVLDCFHKVSGLKINMSKSNVIGFYVDSGRVHRAAYKLGCLVLKTPFLYLGSLVGGNMHRLQAWNDIVDRVRRRLSK